MLIGETGASSQSRHLTGRAILFLLLCLFSFFSRAETLPTLSLEPGKDAALLKNYLRYRPVEHSFSPVEDLSQFDLSGLRPVVGHTIEFGPAISSDRGIGESSPHPRGQCFMPLEIRQFAQTPLARGISEEAA